MTCEFESECSFFGERSRERAQMLATFRARYCRGGKRDCARYVVASSRGADAVPTDLYPHDRLRAASLVQDATHPSDPCMTE